MRRKIYEIILNSIFREARIMLRHTPKVKVNNFVNPADKNSFPTSVNESVVEGLGMADDDYDEEEGGM